MQVFRETVELYNEDIQSTLVEFVHPVLQRRFSRKETAKPCKVLQNPSTNLHPDSERGGSDCEARRRQALFLVGPPVSTFIYRMINMT